MKARCDGRTSRDRPKAVADVALSGLRQIGTFAGLASAITILLAIGDGSSAEPFSLSEAHMSRITAGGIVADATSVATGLGRSPRTVSDADASVDPRTGEARARGKGRGPRGSDGSASIRVSDDKGEFSTEAGADGSSQDHSSTTVEARGKASLSPTDYDGGSTARAKAPNSHTYSNTEFTPDGGEVSSDASAEGAGAGAASTGSSTEVVASIDGDNISHRTRASGRGDDTSVASARGSLMLKRFGRVIEIGTNADSSSDTSSSAEVRHVVIQTKSGTIIRTLARSNSTGARLGDPSAGIDIVIPGGGGGLLLADRAVRRAGEARANSIILVPAR
jgi:hypothetical protein